ncbi:MAG: hypothetical protein ACR2LX_14050, partial [Jatrophihabitans sp.]
MTSRPSTSSAPAGYRFPREVIAVAVRWYLRCGLSYRDVEELLAERGIEVDHLTVYRCFVDETYVKVAGRWTYGGFWRWSQQACWLSLSSRRRSDLGGGAASSLGAGGAGGVAAA